VYNYCCFLLELISDHKKSLALQETSSKVSASSAKLAAVSERLGNAAKKECLSSVSFTHRTATANQMSALSVTNSSAESVRKGHQKNILENVDRVAMNSADSGMHKVLKADDGDAIHSSPYRLCSADVQNEEVSETRSDTSRQTTGFKAPDVVSALAADMVNLYRSKVLPTVLSSQCRPSVIPASTADSRVKNSRMLHNVADVQMPNSSVMQAKRTVAGFKSPFKLVKAKTVPSSACCGETHLLSVLKSSQALAHIDKSTHDIPGKWANSSTLTSSFGHLDSKPGSTAVSGNRTVSCSYAVPKSLSMQITLAVSSQSNVISSTSDSVTDSSFANFVHGKNASPNVTYTSSRYRLIRKREFTCKNTPKRTYVTSLKDASVTPFVSHQVAKHSPSLLVVNKYKLVRKKRQSLTLSAKKTTNVKRMSPSMKLNRDVMPSLCRNPSVSNVKPRSSRYKLVRRNHHQPLSTLATPVKPIMQAAPSRADDKVQVLSKYKLVRRRSSAMIRTPQRATSTPTDSSQRMMQYTRSFTNKHITPPLFLNKYKLIRKRALLRSSVSSCKNFTLRSTHCLTRSGKPSSEGHKHLYSAKQHGILDTSSLYKKHRTRKTSFLSKYALQRSGKGRRYFMFV